MHKPSSRNALVCLMILGSLLSCRKETIFFSPWSQIPAVNPTPMELREVKFAAVDEAYNPAIIAFDRSYIMAFRHDLQKYAYSHDDDSKNQQSFIGLGLLDEAFDPVGSVSWFPSSADGQTQLSKLEDPRLFRWNMRLFLLYNDLVGAFRRQFIAEISVDEQMNFSFGKKRQLRYEKSRKVEKNWTPFIFADQLYFIYSLDPIIILRASKSDQNDIIDMEEVKLKASSSKSVGWQFGKINGGTPAVYDSESKQYVSFFHSHILEPNAYGYRRKYYMGAISFKFDGEAFLETHTQQPIFDPSFYHAENPVTHMQVAFPSGLIMKENDWLLSVGLHDVASLVVIIKRSELPLLPVESTEPKP